MDISPPAKKLSPPVKKLAEAIVDLIKADAKLQEAMSKIPSYTGHLSRAQYIEECLKEEQFAYAKAAENVYERIIHACETDSQTNP